MTPGARALWKGSIAFGLVNIPVALHKAVRDSRPRFRMLHATDRSPVRFERVSLAAEWDPAKYTDRYRENLMRIIKGKAKGRHVELEAEKEPRQAEVIDLMERLQRSLA